MTTNNAINSIGAGSALSSIITQASHGFSVGNWLYYTGSAYALANANAATTAEVIGVVSSVTSVNIFILTTGGYVTGLSGLTTGDVHYLSDSSAGAITTTVPTTTNHISKPVLVADSTTSGFLINFRGEILPSSTTPPLVFIQQQTPSAQTSIVFTGLSNTYQKYILVINGLTLSAGSQNLGLRCSTNNGSSYDNTSAYNWSQNITKMNGTSSNTAAGNNSGSTTSSTIRLLNTVDTSAQNITVEIYNAGVTGGTFALTVHGVTTDSSSNFYSMTGGGNYTGATNVNAFEILTSPDNFTGTFTLWGLTI